MMNMRRYTYGFVFSVFLTLEAFVFVHYQILAGTLLLVTILLLAILQLLVQLVFFLHLGDERRPRWNLLTFLFMVMIVGIVVLGTLWIMKSLDYNHVHQPSDNSIIEDEGIGTHHN